MGDSPHVSLTDDGVDFRMSASEVNSPPDGAVASKPHWKHAPNTYAAKKSVAQGMMDIALITANANQLRYLMEYASETRTYHLNVTLISISLVVQVAVGICLIFKGNIEMMSEEEKRDRKQTLNTIVVVGVFVVTIINVFVAAFSLSPTAVVAVPPPPQVEAASVPPADPGLL